MAGELVTAALMNTHLRDNMQFMSDSRYQGGFPASTAKGYYWAIPGTSNSSSLTLTQDLLYFIPFWVPAPVNVDRLGFYVVTGAATSNARIAIYADGGSWSPTTLLVDGGSFTTTTNAQQREATITLALGVGNYWFGLVRQGVGNPSIGSSARQQGKYALGDTTLQPNLAVLHYGQAAVSGALPNPASGVAVVTGGTARFGAWIRTAET